MRASNQITLLVISLASALLVLRAGDCESNKKPLLLPNNSGSGGNEKSNNSACGSSCGSSTACTIYQFTSPSPGVTICVSGSYNDKCKLVTQSGTVATIPGTCQSGYVDNQGVYQCTCAPSSNPQTTYVNYPYAVTCQ